MGRLEIGRAVIGLMAERTRAGKLPMPPGSLSTCFLPPGSWPLFPQTSSLIRYRALPDVTESYQMVTQSYRLLLDVTDSYKLNCRKLLPRNDLGKFRTQKTFGL